HGDALHMQPVAAVLAIPGKAIELLRLAAPLHDDSDGARRTARRMRYLGRQEKDLALPDRHVGETTVLHRLPDDVPLHLIEELLAGVMMEVLARVRPTDRHDDEAAVLEEKLVADRRLQELAVSVDPAIEIEGGAEGHPWIIQVRARIPCNCAPA